MNETVAGYSYEQIDELVMEYQAGNKDSAQKLLEIFEPYLKKYLRIMKDGLINLNDNDSRKFISLFINDFEARRKLVKNYLPTEAIRRAYLATAMVNDACNEMSRDDMMQELTVIFLTLAKRYKKKGKKINFCGYLYNVFRFELYRRINDIIVDPLVYKAGNNLSYNDESYINQADAIDEDQKVYIDEPIMILDEDLGNSWVRGLTCNDVFAKLTPLQRLILKMSYVDGISDVSIADRLGMHRNSIANQRETAIQLIEKSEGELYGKRENNQVHRMREDS